MTAKKVQWTLPESNSLIGFGEEFVRMAAQAIAQDADALADAVVGHDRRPFMSVKMTLEERMMRHRVLREQMNPAGWLQLLQASGPRRASMLQEARRWVELDVKLLRAEEEA